MECSERLRRSWIAWLSSAPQVVVADPAATSVLEPLPGQLHFVAPEPGQPGGWAVLAVALPEGDAVGHERAWTLKPLPRHPV